MVIDGAPYPTVEHAYQASKTGDLKAREKIRRSPTPGKAKRLGRQAKLSLLWESEKIDVMRGLLMQKFSHLHPELRKKLLATGHGKIIEANSWGDQVWGACLENGVYVGENHLGHLLMEVRERIRLAEGLSLDLAHELALFPKLLAAAEAVLTESQDANYGQLRAAVEQAKGRLNERKEK